MRTNTTHADMLADIEEPTAMDLATVPEIERDWIAEFRAVESARAIVEPDHASRIEAAARRAAIRTSTGQLPGATAVYMATRYLNTTARRKTATAVLGQLASIDSVEVLDVTGEHTVRYPLARVISDSAVTVWPVRQTPELMEKFRRAAETMAAIEDKESPEYLAASIVWGELNASHGKRTVAWDGTSESLIAVLKKHAPHRVAVLADRSRDELRMRRSHRTNQRVGKAARDMAMAQAIDAAMGTTDSTDTEGQADYRPSQALVLAGIALSAQDMAMAKRAAERWQKMGLPAHVAAHLEAWVAEGETAKARERRRAQAKARVLAGKDWAPRGYAVQGTDVATARLINQIKRSR